MFTIVCNNVFITRNSISAVLNTQTCCTTVQRVWDQPAPPSAPPHTGKPQQARPLHGAVEPAQESRRQQPTGTHVREHTTGDKEVGGWGGEGASDSQALLNDEGPQGAHVHDVSHRVPHIQGTANVSDGGILEATNAGGHVM